MAGTVVTTEITHGSIKKIKFAWTSAAGGQADATTTSYYNGKILHMCTVPDGVAAPTDDYDIEIKDSDNVDVLAGAGADRDTANIEHVLSALMGAVAHSQLTLAITNAGNAKKGTIYLYIR